MNFTQFPVQSPITQDTIKDGGYVVGRGWLQSFVDATAILQGNWIRGSVKISGLATPTTSKMTATPFHAMLTATWDSSFSVTAGAYVLDGVRADFVVGDAKRGATTYVISTDADGKLIFPTIPSGSGDLILTLFIAVKERGL